MRLTCFLALTCAVLERGHAIAESDQVALASGIVPVSRILQPSALSVEDSSEKKSLRSRESPEEEATAFVIADEERVLEAADTLIPFLEKGANMVKKIWSKPSQASPIELKLDQLNLDQSKLGQLKPPHPVPGQVEPLVPPHKILKRTSTMQRSKRLTDLVAYGTEKATSSGLKRSGRVADLTALVQGESRPSTLKRPREKQI
ncbi:unnamed protein product [Hyaloperonospora brassicae]|uniref:RxLR effector candidate protein n=1 Tax=Hyaloperonospora brassicae TaxID=162125 RepID=A0AAV0V5X4_HYABA|nr:unnamed protein product [Hyaloperonospora brassicae]